MPVDPASFSIGDINLLDPTGTPIPLADGAGNPLPGVSLTPNAGTNNTAWTLVFPTQHKPRFYTLQVGPDVHDTLGDPMNQNHNSAFGDPGYFNPVTQTGGDGFSGTLFVQGLAVSSFTATNPVVNATGTVIITFNMPVKPATFTLVGGDVQLIDPSGNSVPLLGATLTDQNPGT